MCFSRKKAKIMGKSKACENSTMLFFVIFARMCCSSAITCLDWTRTPFFSLVWTKILFFFSFPTDIAVKKKNQVELRSKQVWAQQLPAWTELEHLFFSLFELNYLFFFSFPTDIAVRNKNKNESTTC